MKITIIDHFDSFTYNLQALAQAVCPKSVVEVIVPQTEDLSTDFLILGPGPGGPGDYPISQKIAAKFLGKTPIFAVCLGMQIINHSQGGGIRQSEFPKHGKTSMLEHNQKGVFHEIPMPFQVMRYHSLYIDPVKPELVCAWDKESKIPMAIEDEKNKYVGVQFHPESFATKWGEVLLENFVGKYVD